MFHSYLLVYFWKKKVISDSDKFFLLFIRSSTRLYIFQGPSELMLPDKPRTSAKSWYRVMTCSFLAAKQKIIFFFLWTMIGVGKIKQYSNILEKPLSKGKQEVSLSAFAFLFSELVQYNQTRVDNIAELERRLEVVGYVVGARVLELLSCWGLSLQAGKAKA
ncbi:hypothetical protein ES288_D10G197700v1 [Gossypium darwinii]|uniref:Trafficking protein particle complex subunit n=1 Tax=Gossypium darwinii TaxID=34276 RepID=A0A5D2B3S1_GOSDA|nr:hypothetical protein ES288_D10G197700v1 [Gossypium darwinii]